MSYSGISNISLASVEQLNLEVERLKRNINLAISKLDQSSIQVIQADITTINNKINDIMYNIKNHDSRISELEDNAANTEITRNDVTLYYGGYV